MDFETAKIKISELGATLKYHNRKYYIEDSPEIEDFEYDRMLRELEDLEKEFTEFLAEDSPTQNVGGGALRLFTPVEQDIINIVIDVLDDVIGDKAEYLITTQKIYKQYNIEFAQFQKYGIITPLDVCKSDEAGNCCSDDAKCPWQGTPVERVRQRDNPTVTQ